MERLRSASKRAPDAAARLAVPAHLRVVEGPRRQPSVVDLLAMSDAVLDSIDLGVAACDPDGRLTVFNRVAREFHGLDADASIGAHHLAETVSLYHCDGATLLRPDEIPLLRSLAGEDVREDEIVIAPQGHPRRLVSCTGQQMQGEDGRVTGAVIAMRDITDHRAAQRALAGSERMFRTAFVDSPLGQAIADADGRIVQVNPALCDMLGYRPSGLLGRRTADLAHPDCPADGTLAFSRVLRGREPNAKILMRYRHSTGRSIWAEVVVSGVEGPNGERLHLVQIEDISARRHAEQVLHEKAHRDPLTGLPNRALLTERVRRSLHQIVDGRGLALMFVDLDGFKSVNDLHGHDAGDAVLVEAGRRLQSLVTGRDTVARIGGDEFVVASADLPLRGPAVTFELAERIIAELSRPFPVADTAVRLSASVGVAFAEETSVTVSELLTRADAAMYRAKHSGKGRHATYAAETAAASVAASRVERIVRRTLDDDKVVVHYQPVVDLRRGLVIGVEALARMPDGAGGFVPPDEFIPVAERCGMIGRLGDAVLRQTLAHTVAWKKILPGHHEFAAGVNLSVRQLGEPGLVVRVEAALAESTLPPDALVLELTESVFSDSDEHAEVLRELRRLGVKLVIDDFGTGYSSLSYLRRFPIDGLKIDRSFVADLVGQDRNRTVTDAIVRMALDLRMPVIAEGIETGMQLSALQALGCPLGQGYLLSRPMTAEQMTALLAADAGRLPGAVLATEKAWSSSS